MTNVIKKNHPSIIFANDIDDICSPLKKFGIAHFTYLRNYKNGSQIYLSNNAKWIEDYYDLKLFESSLFELPCNHYDNGFSLWPESNKPVFKHAQQYFNSDNGITLAEKSEKFTDFYFFSSTRDNKQIINFYLNNIDLLKRFVIYFKDKAAKILDKMENNKIYIPRTNREKLKTDPEFLFVTENISKQNVKDLRNLFLAETKIKSYKICEGKLQIKLSAKEIDCILPLLEGKTAEEIADSLFRSRRTVETHINNLKAKLNCKTKSELIDKLLKNGLGFYLSHNFG